MAPRHLFRKLDIFAVQLHQQEQMKKAAWQLPPEKLSEDDEKVASELAAEFTMDLPTLDESAIYQSDRQVQIDARKLPNRMIFDRSRPVWVNGTEITIHIPFKGDPAVFDVQPSTHNLNPPFADVDVKANEILLVYQVTDANSPVKAQYEKTLQEIKQHLEWLRPAATQVDGLKQVCRTELAKRKQANHAHENIVGSLGLPRRNAR